jgi:hypothetical protein
LQKELFEAWKQCLYEAQYGKNINAMDAFMPAGHLGARSMIDAMHLTRLYPMCGVSKCKLTPISVATLI